MTYVYDRVGNAMNTIDTKPVASVWRAPRAKVKADAPKGGFSGGQAGRARARGLRFVTMLVVGAVMLSVGGVVEAGGPRGGDFYLTFGAGIFQPTFAIPEGQESLEGQQIDALVLEIGGLAIPVPLTGDIDEGEENPENLDILSFGGALGYQFTDQLGVEIALDLAFPEIQLQDVGLSDVIGGDAQAGQVQVLQPGILPVTISGIYTMMPSWFVSPYVGLGVMAASFENRRASTDSAEIMMLEGGLEFGYVVQAGARADLGDDWFGYAEVKYGRINDPDIQDLEGNDVQVDMFEMRHIRVGAGFSF